MSILRGVKEISQSIIKSANPPPIFIDPSQYRSQMSDMFMAGGAGPLYSFYYNGHGSAISAYKKCPPLASIINKKAKCYINGKTWIMNKEGKESQSEYAKKLRKLLARPNPIQSWKQFEAQQYIYTQLFGWCLCLPIIPVGFAAGGPVEATSLWNIPPIMVDVTETNKMWFQTDITGIIKTVKLSYKGVQTELDIKNLWIFRDFTPSFDSMVFPDSRVCSIEMPINNIIGAYESRNVLINYRGALGIISADSDKTGYIPIKEEDKTDLQNDFMRYGLKGQQWKFIITSAAVKWQQMGVPTRDLMLFEEVEGATMAICDQYDYPYRLMAAEKSASYNDVKEFKKLLYQDAIIPEGMSFAEQWMQMFRMAENNCYWDRDYSHIPVMQQDNQATANARKTLGEALDKEFRNNWITLNRVLQLLGEDTRGTEGDRYYSELVAEGFNFGSAGLTLTTQPTA